MAGIYLHIPFCRQACHYCNFHFSTSLKLKDEMINAMIKEICITPAIINERGEQENTIQTIYFGGGTPSLLNEQDLNRLMEILQQRFSITADAEITLEANPDDVNNDQLKVWKHAGINRLSMGIQSFMEEELVWMNRAHHAIQSLECIDRIKDHGFSNFTIDLIYGSPLLDNVQWRKNVDIVINKEVPHISCYALTVEPKTALAKQIVQQKKTPVDADKQANQFLLLMQWMREAGYEHYEISNYAKPGMRSRHNSSYWQGEKYYGFGPSAHSYDGIHRRWNIANNAMYIRSIEKGAIPFEEETLTPVQQLNEYIMTALRTAEGINPAIIETRFGEQYADQIKKAAWRYLQTGKLIISSNIYLTDEGKLFADGIAADLFF